MTNFSNYQCQKFEMMTKEEKQILYSEHKINPYLNLIYPIPPFTGYYRIGHFKEGIIKYFILFAATQSLVALGDYNFLYGIDRSDGAFEKRIDTSGKITMVILSFDLYFQTKKYNRNLYKTIFKN